jgi:hypothetical protein
MNRGVILSLGLSVFWPAAAMETQTTRAVADSKDILNIECPLFHSVADESCSFRPVIASSPQAYS